MSGGQETGASPPSKRTPPTPDPPEEFYEGDPAWPAVTTCYGEADLNLACGYLDANEIDYRERVVDCGVAGNIGLISEPRITLYVHRHQYIAAKKILDPDSFLEDWEEIGGEHSDQTEAGTKPGEDSEKKRILGIPRDLFEMIIVFVLMSILATLAFTSDYF